MSGSSYLAESRIIYETVIADAIREIDKHNCPGLTSESFLNRLDQMLEETCKRDLDQIEYLEGAVRKRHAALLRSYDLLSDMKARPRETRH